MVSSVPPELEAAIERASRDKSVPPDILAGIWRIESGSTFPNDAVNAEGYGGLFGTSAAQVSPAAPPLEQAEYAGGVLRNLLVSNQGDISQALYDYSGHGYTQVPGETTFGIFNPGVGAGSPLPSNPHPQAPASSPIPILTSGSGTGDFGPGGSFGGGGGDFNPSPGGGGIGSCWTGLASGCKWYEPWNCAKVVVSVPQAIGCSLGWLAGQIKLWLERLGMILGGAALVLLGLYLVAKDAGAMPTGMPAVV